MIPKDKDLLLKDICARLPYGLKGKCEIDASYDTSFDTIFQIHKFDVILEGIKGDLLFVTPLIEDKDEQEFANEEVADGIDILDFKPYLRPMSSMTEEEAKELLFVRLSSRYGESCAYIENFIKLDEVYFQTNLPYKGSIIVWFSFENRIYGTPQMRLYSKCEYLGQIDDLTLADIDWLNAHHFDYRGLIEKDLAVEVTEENNPYKE